MHAKSKLNTRQLNMLTSELVVYQDQLAAIHELANRFSGRLNISAAVQSLVETAVRAISVHSAGVRLELPEQPVVDFCTTTWSGSDDGLVEALAWVREKEDYLLQNEDGRSLLPRSDNFLLLPLQVRGQIVGVLALADKVRGRFTMPDVKLGQALTAQLNVQIENTLWHESQVARAAWQAQLELAQEVQRCLLPQELPPLKGLEVWAASNSLHEVGGDLYDFIPASQGVPFMAVGDVCGKGVSAAMLMTMTRTTLRNAAAFLPGTGPAGLLHFANSALYADYTEVGMFASLFIGQYLPDAQLLRYANAGHAPVIYCPAAGNARLLPAGNASIGLLPEAAMIESEIAFGPGDVLVVASDGFTEAMDAQEELFGYERLLETVSRCAGQNAASIGAVIKAVVSVFCGSRPQTDDQTLVVVKGRS